MESGPFLSSLKQIHAPTKTQQTGPHHEYGGQTIRELDSGRPDILSHQDTYESIVEFSP